MKKIIKILCAIYSLTWLTANVLSWLGVITLPAMSEGTSFLISLGAFAAASVSMMLE